MYTQAAVLDMHTRAHRALVKLLDHCRGLTAEELVRPIEGFGDPTVREQLWHVISAEEYWVGVIQGKMLADENGDRFPDITALEAYRENVAATTASYLQSASDAELSGRRDMTTWGGNVNALVPAHILLRITTHIFQHQGQVLAMCRLMGKPGPGRTDFPLD